MQFKNIAIEGNIGSGKTSLAKKLASHFKADLILEEYSNNPFLEEYYKSKNDALALELFFLNTRHDQLTRLKKTKEEKPVISDYYYGKSLIFAKNNLLEQEFALYTSIYGKLIKDLNQPDLIIYLNCGLKNLIKRIEKRGRNFEKNISESYLSELSKGYNFFFKNESSIRFIFIETDNINFIENENDFGTILEYIFNAEKK